MDSLPFSTADLSVAVILLVSAILAYVRGFVHEVLAVTAWIGAALAAIYALPYLQPLASGLLGPEPGLLFELMPLQAAFDFAMGVVVFIVTLVTLSAFSRAISRRIRQSTLHLLCRSLGLPFGLLADVIGIRETMFALGVASTVFVGAVLLYARRIDARSDAHAPSATASATDATATPTAAS